MESTERTRTPREGGGSRLALALAMGACVGAALLLALAVRLAANTFLPGLAGGGAARDMPKSTLRFAAEEVRDLRISWELGPVAIRQVDATETDGGVLVEEEYLDEGLEDYPLQARLETGELSLTYGAGATAQLGNKGKRLTVLVPKGEGALGSVRLTISNDLLDLRDLACENLAVQLGSGIVRARKVSADQLDLEVSSGDAEVDGSFVQGATIKLGSGNARVSSDVTPHDTRLEVTSGDAELRLPRDAGFSARVQVTSGSFDLDFAAREEDDAYVVGHGENRVDVSVTSGSARIAKR